KGMCPVAEKVYEQILSLPIHPEVSQKDVDKVVSVLLESIK
ncbi:MAG: DegT/DnrJ/EryC1/StrS family aminotransferase, partial [Desulfobulbaceae bacterium]|nr:DegT/DnrJ/EryC1/StrS family aminotransferase [Desulfobulbaceae bacterium]